MPVLEKAKTAYKNWLETNRNVERAARFSLGLKIDNLFLEILELIRKAAYTPINKKMLMLEEVAGKIDSLRFFFQLLWEAHLVSNKQYVSLGAEIEDIGRIIGGWRKGLFSKTSAIKAEERK